MELEEVQGHGSVIHVDEETSADQDSRIPKIGACDSINLEDNEVEQSNVLGDMSENLNNKLVSVISENPMKERLSLIYNGTNVKKGSDGKLQEDCEDGFSQISDSGFCNVDSECISDGQTHQLSCSVNIVDANITDEGNDSLQRKCVSWKDPIEKCYVPIDSSPGSDNCLDVLNRPLKSSREKLIKTERKLFNPSTSQRKTETKEKKSASRKPKVISTASANKNSSTSEDRGRITLGSVNSNENECINEIQGVKCFHSKSSGSVHKEIQNRSMKSTVKKRKHIPSKKRRHPDFEVSDTKVANYLTNLTSSTSAPNKLSTCTSVTEKSLMKPSKLNFTSYIINPPREDTNPSVSSTEGLPALDRENSTTSLRVKSPAKKLKSDPSTSKSEPKGSNTEQFSKLDLSNSLVRDCYVKLEDIGLTNPVCRYRKIEDISWDDSDEEDWKGWVSLVHPFKGTGYTLISVLEREGVGFRMLVSDEEDDQENGDWQGWPSPEHPPGLARELDLAFRTHHNISTDDDSSS